MPTLMERISELAGPDVAEWIRAEFGGNSHYIARADAAPVQTEAQRARSDAAVHAVEEALRRGAAQLAPLAATQP